MAGPFTIIGNVTGLFPGAHKPLALTLGNTNPYALAITSVTVSVVGSSRCSAMAVLPVGVPAL